MYPAAMPIPTATPAGIAKRATDCRNRSGRHGPELGASASTNAGMPIVTVEAIVNWRGRSGNVAVGTATASPSTAVNTAFVTNSCATRWMLRRICRPSSTIPGTTAKSERTNTRSATERAIWTPEPLRDRQTRLLERGHVVDAVADHRHVTPGLAERCDDGTLSLR